MSLFRPLFIFILLASVTLAESIPPLDPNLPDPAYEKNTNTWKKYGESFDQFAGVEALSNHADGKGGKYQCTELVHRYLNQALGMPTKIGMGLGHAKDLLQNLATRFEQARFRIAHVGKDKYVRVKFIKNDSAIEAPVRGAPISFNLGRYGHVAIIRAVKSKSENELELFLFEQHGELPFSVGAKKPIRSVVATRNAKGFWSVPQAIGWLIFLDAERP